jgi:hypothetical protein
MKKFVLSINSDGSLLHSSKNCADYQGEKINAKKNLKRIFKLNGFILKTQKCCWVLQFYECKIWFESYKCWVEYSNYYQLESTIYPFFERERTTKTVNLIPFAVDAALSVRAHPILDGLPRELAIYIIIMSVRDAELKDCLILIIRSNKMYFFI